MRLYTNGVFHSQFNPERVFTGAIWDCLSLPTLYHQSFRDRDDEPLRILVLGVGGGAVLKQLRVLHEQSFITGVELDAAHLLVARRWFGVSHRRDELVHADACDWVEKNASLRFDIIIDDLFTEDAGNPVRAVSMDRCWSNKLTARLTSGGMLVANFISNAELRDAVRYIRAALPCALSFQHPGYENAVGVFLPQTQSPATWQQLLDSHLGLNAVQRRTAKELKIKIIKHI